MRSGGGSFAQISLHGGQDWWTFLNTYDDHSPDYNWQLWPYVMGSVEYQDGSDAGNGKTGDIFKSGAYIEFGVRPTFTLYKFDVNKDLTLAVPAATFDARGVAGTRRGASERRRPAFRLPRRLALRQ